MARGGDKQGGSETKGFVKPKTLSARKFHDRIKSFPLLGCLFRFGHKRITTSSAQRLKVSTLITTTSTGNVAVICPFPSFPIDILLSCLTFVIVLTPHVEAIDNSKQEISPHVQPAVIF